MVVIIHRIRVPICHVNTEAVIDVTVAVVIDPVAVAVGRVVKHVGGQVRVSVVDAGIDHGHYGIAAAGGDVPGGGGIDFSEAVKAAKARIVWRGRQFWLGCEPKLIVRLAYSTLGSCS